jgi:hypothetical protein
MIFNSRRLNEVSRRSPWKYNRHGSLEMLPIRSFRRWEVGVSEESKRRCSASSVDCRVLVAFSQQRRGKFFSSAPQ